MVVHPSNADMITDAGQCTRIKVTIVPHFLRYTCTFMLAQAGVDIETQAKMHNHSIEIVSQNGALGESEIEQAASLSGSRRGSTRSTASRHVVTRSKSHGGAIHDFRNNLMNLRNHLFLQNLEARCLSLIKVFSNATYLAPPRALFILSLTNIGLYCKKVSSKLEKFNIIITCSRKATITILDKHILL